MYAIIQTGGKQYRVEKGDQLEVERLGAQSGAVEFKEVLMLNDGKQAHIGTPHVAKCLVKGEIMEEVKGPKVVSFKIQKTKKLPPQGWSQTKACCCKNYCY